MTPKPVLPKRELSLFQQLQAFIAAVQSLYTTASTFVVDGRNLPQLDFLRPLQADYALYTAAIAAQHAFDVAMQTLVAALPGIKSRFLAAQAAVRVDKGLNNPELASFGIKLPKRPAPRPLTDRVIAVAKANETKKARGSIGKRQRQSITTTGQSGVSVITPSGTPIVLTHPVSPIPPSGGAPAPSPAPVPPAPSTPTASPAPSTVPTAPAATPTNGSANGSSSNH